MKRYHSLHFFLDESGEPRNVVDGKTREPVLVGGMLVFGAYDADADRELHHLLKDELNKVGGRFPGDLHMAKTGLARSQIGALFAGLAQAVEAWAGTIRACHGISLEYAGDVFPAGPTLLAERAYDNRYVAMAWALIEHLAFVDDEVKARLHADAALHVHIANRAYPMDGKYINPAELEALGWRVENDKRQPGWFVVKNVLPPEEVRGMLRSALRQRWRHELRDFTDIQVVPIDYVQGKSPAALYLADMVLGQKRSMMLAAKGRNDTPLTTPLVPAWRALQYDANLERMAAAKSALSAGDLEEYLRLSSEIVAGGHPVLQQLDAQAIDLLARSPDRALSLLLDASVEADQPGLSEAGAHNAERAIRVLRRLHLADARAEALALQVRFSHANHQGQVEQAGVLWDEFVKLQPQLQTLGLDGLRLTTELRNRRAVNLMDRFEYAAAEEVLTKLISDGEKLLPTVAAAFGIDLTNVPDRELGACHGSLGQLYAFRGTDMSRLRAQQCFRRALSLFQENRNCERQWVYLGHLACDQGEAGRSLWREVAGQVPELQGGQPVIRSGGQFLLALQIKAQTVFADLAGLNRFVQHCEESKVLDGFAGEVCERHPFGLLRQALALAHARLWRETRNHEHYDQARDWFDAARGHLMKGGKLLQALGLVSNLRRHLLDAEVLPGREEKLTRAFQKLKAYLMDEFGAAAWLEDQAGRSSGHFGALDPGVGTPFLDRARSVLSGVRFNFW